MSELTIFKNSQFGEVRVIELEGNVLFSASDVAKCLGYSNPRDAVSRHCDSEDVVKHDTPTSSGNQLIAYINESGVYALIFGSKMEQAKDFKKWVTSEVLPSIRKHGAYMTDSTIENMVNNPDLLIQLATNLKEERRQREMLQHKAELQSMVIERDAPKVEYFNEVLQSESTYTTTQIAKEMGMAAPTLNKKLHEYKIQYKQNGTWLLYEKHQDKGYTKTKTHTYSDNGITKTSMLTVWTEKGRLFIHSILNPN